MPMGKMHAFSADEQNEPVKRPLTFMKEDEIENFNPLLWVGK